MYGCTSSSNEAFIASHLAASNILAGRLRRANDFKLALSSFASCSLESSSSCLGFLPPFALAFALAFAFPAAFAAAFAFALPLAFALGLAAGRLWTFCFGSRALALGLGVCSSAQPHHQSSLSQAGSHCSGSQCSGCHGSPCSHSLEPEFEALRAFLAALDFFVGCASCPPCCRFAWTYHALPSSRLSRPAAAHASPARWPAGKGAAEMCQTVRTYNII